MSLIKIYMDKNKKIKINKKILIPLVVILIIAITAVSIVIFKKIDNDVITTTMQFDYLGYDQFYENEEETNILVEEANGILMSLYFENYETVTVREEIDPVAVNTEWMKYGYNHNVVSNNEGKYKLTYMRLCELLYDTRIQIGNEQRYTSNELNLNTEEYVTGQIEALNYLYHNELITQDDINKEKLQTYVDKSYFEDIIVKYVFKYSLMHINDSKINYEASLNIPQNKNYFFVLDNVSDKELDYGLLKEKEETYYMSPKEVYAYIPKEIPKINELINNYFNTILNVNPENVEEGLFKYNVKNNCIVSNDEIENYCKYVKENNINFTGKATIISPIIYKVDGTYYVRTKLEININNSNTTEDILFGDLGNKIKYDNNTIKYIDVPIQKETFGWDVADSKLYMYTVK